MGASTRQAPQSIPEGPLQRPPGPGDASGAPSGQAREPARRPAPSRGCRPRGPGGAGSWAARSRAAPSHAVHSGGTRNSLAMSAAEAGGVFHRARGRTLDAFPAGTRGADDFRAAEPSAGGTFSLGARASSRTPLGPQSAPRTEIRSARPARKGFPGRSDRRRRARRRVAEPRRP